MRNLFIIIFVSSILFIACKDRFENTVISSESLRDTSGFSEIVLASHAGGLRTKKIKKFDKENAELSFSDDINISFEKYKSHVEWAVPQSAFPENWKGYRWFALDYKVYSESPIIKVSIYGSRNVLSDTISESDLKSGTLKISLDDLPLTGRNINLYNPIRVRISNLDSSLVEMKINRFVLIKDRKYEFKPVVDKYGQRINGNWDGKVKTDKGLLKTHFKELEELNRYSRPDTIDRYGGNKNLNFKETGYFYVTNNDGKYCFVTPEGNAFWSLGVTGVRSMYSGSDVTKVKGREFLYEELPDYLGENPGLWDLDTNFSFYKWNILRKYDSLGQWHEMTLKRLKAWGVNTIGNWSEKELLLKSKIPFTFSFRASNYDELKIEGTSFADVFDPRWKRHLDSIFDETDEFKDNTYLIGYFVDNEGSWGKVVLNFAENESVLRERWLAMVKHKYHNINKLNFNWKTNINSWDEVKYIRPEEYSNDFIQSDSEKFNTLFSEEYFKTISEALKEHDPNHLYLGCRFTRRLKPDYVLKAAGKYSDVVTVNVYNMTPVKEDMDKWHSLTGRPLLIGEHHFPLLSQRQLPPHYRAFTAKEREKFFKNYVKVWANMDYSVGSHRYQYVDQHLTGRAIDGENQTVGVVDITDKPHQELVRALKHCSKNLYKWHYD